MLNIAIIMLAGYLLLVSFKICQPLCEFCSESKFCLTFKKQSHKLAMHIAVIKTMREPRWKTNQKNVLQYNV